MRVVDKTLRIIVLSVNTPETGVQWRQGRTWTYVDASESGIVSNHRFDSSFRSTLCFYVLCRNDWSKDVFCGNVDKWPWFIEIL